MKLQSMKGSVSHTNLPQPTGVNCVTIYQIGSREQLKTQSRHFHHKSKSIVHLNFTTLPNPNGSSDVASTLPTNPTHRVTHFRQNGSTPDLAAASFTPRSGTDIAFQNLFPERA